MLLFCKRREEASGTIVMVKGEQSHARLTAFTAVALFRAEAFAAVSAQHVHNFCVFAVCKLLQTAWPFANMGSEEERTHAAGSLYDKKMHL